MDLIIRPLQTPADGQLIEEITAAAWGSDIRDVVPFHLTFTIAKENAGVVLLAFDGRQPVGFCLGFWAYNEEDNRWQCASHMAAVLPAYRGRGLGEKIKWAQRRFVQEKGFNLITWTYDPLETLNGSLNIRKLGAICQDYVPNMYGDLDDSLNRGIPTDRFRVAWWINSAWVNGRKERIPNRYTVEFIESHPHLALNVAVLTETGLPAVSDVQLDRITGGDDIAYFAPVPRHFQQIKKEDAALALQWRLATRVLFQTAFKAGYTVVDLIGDSDADFCYYILEKNWHPDNPS